jgi:clan AA aspartic protease
VPTGTVNADLEPVVSLLIRGPEGHLEIETIVDTGFNGFLLVAPEVIAKLGLQLYGTGRGILADGSEVAFLFYEAIVFWNGRLRRIPVGVADSASLLGMALMYGSELALQVVEGGEVFLRDMSLS